MNQLDVRPLAVIPISAKAGENIVEKSSSMPWHSGSCLLEALDSMKSIYLGFISSAPGFKQWDTEVGAPTDMNFAVV